MVNTSAEAATGEDDRCEEEIFEGRGDRHVLLQAIAYLEEALIVKVADSTGCVDWHGMVDEVRDELLRWALEV